MLTNYLALDIGQARVGVALANDVARIASALPALANDDCFLTHLQALVTEYQVQSIVAGLPRGLEGQHTAQTAYVEDLVDKLKTALPIPIHLQDEAVTSVKAEAELKRRGVAYEKGDIDSLSAVYILEDFLLEGVH